jgi:NAD(P)-dependent dehydrogenase (short-subunit alcohol dehydrogenase family)
VRNSKFGKIEMTTGSSVLIFGGVGGIGEALARCLCAAGQTVFITSRDAVKVETVARNIGAQPLVCDVLDDASIASAVAAASVGGPLSGLVYAVGSIPLKPLSRLTSDDMMTAYRLNVVGAMVAMRQAADGLKQHKGSVVLFSSIAAQQGFSLHAAIGAAKGAVEGLTISLAAEMAPLVRVNAIAPSLTATPIASGILQNEKMADSIAALHPIPRIGTADEMAALAQFLLSPDAGWITGQVIGVDGGRSRLRTGRS